MDTINIMYIAKALVLTLAFAASLSLVCIIVFAILINDKDQRIMAQKAVVVFLLIASLPVGWGLGYMRFPMIDKLWDDCFSGKMFAMEATAAPATDINLKVQVENALPVQTVEETDSAEETASETAETSEETEAESSTSTASEEDAVESDGDETDRLRGRGAWRF